MNSTVPRSVTETGSPALLTRRVFAASAAAPLMGAAGPRFVKGICWAAFPKGASFVECMRQSRNAGFDALEIRMDTEGEITLRSTVEQMKRLRDAAESHRIEIASLWILTPSSPSLASPDPAVRESALAMVRKGIELAPALGCDALLVVPGVLGRGAKFEVNSDQAWKRSTEAFRRVLPMAERARVVLTPENVWSRFLVSPLDMRRFVDQFRSPSVQVHLDTGNVMQFGYPQDWIQVLGKRIRRVHLKDYKLASGGMQGRFVPLLEGDVQWPDVMANLVAAGYRGFISAEVGPNPADPHHLMTVSKAVDRILAMA